MLDFKFTLIDPDTAKIEIAITAETTMGDLAEFYMDESGYMGKVTLIYDENGEPCKLSCIVQKKEVQEICKNSKRDPLDENVSEMLASLAKFGMISRVYADDLPEGVEMYVFNDEKDERGH